MLLTVLVVCAIIGSCFMKKRNLWTPERKRIWDICTYIVLFLIAPWLAVIIFIFFTGIPYLVKKDKTKTV